MLNMYRLVIHCKLKEPTYDKKTIDTVLYEGDDVEKLMYLYTYYNYFYKDKEGYTLEDFKHVVDVKVYNWKKDPKMSAYIRPQTLFGTKMENYVNEKITKPSWQVENDYHHNTKDRRI